MEKPKIAAVAQDTKAPVETKKSEAPKAEAKAQAKSSKPETQGITQREAVYAEVMRLIRDEKITIGEKQPVKPLLTETHIKRICTNLVAGFQARKIALKDTESNKLKLADARAMELYCLGLLNNWLRRDNRLNGTLAQQ